jgi:hypothetical protein
VEAGGGDRRGGRRVEAGEGHPQAPASLVMEMTKVDLCGVQHGGARWPEARAALTASMAAHGFVVIAHGVLGPEPSAALFARALAELYALPTEAKLQDMVTTRSRTRATSPMGRRLRACLSGIPPTPPASATTATSSGRSSRAILSSGKSIDQSCFHLAKIGRTGFLNSLPLLCQATPLYRCSGTWWNLSRL